MKGWEMIKAGELESVHFAARRFGFLRQMVGSKLFVINQHKGYYHEKQSHSFGRNW